MSKSYKNTLTNLSASLKNQGEVVSSDFSASAYSAEDAQQFNRNFKTETQEVSQIISTELENGLGIDFSEASLEGYNLKGEALKAGVIAHMAASNPAAYMRSTFAQDSDASSLESLRSGPGGSLPLSSIDQYSQESFDNTQLANYDVQNIILNVQAAQQDAFGEGFFPTKVIAPNAGGLSVTVDVQEVIEDLYHETDGSALNQTRRRLSDAIMDPAILDNPSTQLVPRVTADSAEYFIDDTLVASTFVKAGKDTIETRPLLVGTSVNLLGISRNPGAVQGQVKDVTYQISPGSKLDSVYVVFYVEGDTPGTNDKPHVVKLKVGEMSQAQFRKSHEGMGRDVTLNFIARNYPLTKDMKTTAGVRLGTLINELEDHTAFLKFTVTGNGNLETGQFELNVGAVNINKIVNNATDAEVSITAGPGKVWADDFKAHMPAIAAFDYDGRLSNSNWSTRGTLIDVTPYTQKYAVVPGYPITVLSPTTEDANASKLSGLINAMRTRISNNAVATLINYADQLGAYSRAFESGITDIGIEGIGGRLVSPFFESKTIDVDSAVVVITTNGRYLDVSRTLVDFLRDAAYRALRDSNYEAVLEHSAGAGTKPHFIIGVDTVTKKHLDIISDPRLLGEYIDYTVVATNNKLMKGKIYMSLTRGRPGTEDGLGFGTHAYMPAAIQRVNATQNHATVTNDRVIPMSVHIPVLPILVELDVANLSEATTNVTP